MDQMILSEPSTIIIWTYQDRMEWMSRILVGEMAGANEVCLRQCWENMAEFFSYPDPFSRSA
jgi:hypothetical protein